MYMRSECFILKHELNAMRCYRILCVDLVLCYATGAVARAGWETRAWAEQPIRSSADDRPTLCSLFGVLAIPLVSDWMEFMVRNNDHHQRRPQISTFLTLSGLGNSIHLLINSPMASTTCLT